MSELIRTVTHAATSRDAGFRPRADSGAVHPAGSRALPILLTALCTAGCGEGQKSSVSRPLGTDADLAVSTAVLDGEPLSEQSLSFRVGDAPVPYEVTFVPPPGGTVASLLFETFGNDAADGGPVARDGVVAASDTHPFTAPAGGGPVTLTGSVDVPSDARKFRIRLNVFAIPPDDPDGETEETGAILGNAVVRPAAGG